MIEVTNNAPIEPSPASLYEGLNSQLLNSSFGASAAEAHGLVTGLACRDFSRPELEQKAALFGFDDDTQTAFWGLLEMTDRDLRETDFKFDLWLPDKGTLGERTQALGTWCHGFVLGLCHDGKTALQTLTKELRESFDDLVSISAAVAESDKKDDEVAFVEVSEYVRITAQLLFEEMNSQQPSQPQEAVQHPDSYNE